MKNIKQKSLYLIIACIFFVSAILFGITVAPKTTHAEVTKDELWTEYASRKTLDELTKSDTINTLEVKNAADLAQIAVIVNAGNSLEGYTIEVSSGIDLSAHFWEPIGNNTTPFKGYFKTNQSTGSSEISGLTIKTSLLQNTTHIGLFGVIHVTPSTEAHLKHTSIALKDVNLIIDHGLNGTTYIGAYAGEFTGTAQDISVKGNINLENIRNDHSVPSYLGGIFGRVNADSRITTASATNGETSAELTFQAKSNNDYKNLYVGGLIGQNHTELNETNFNYRIKNTEINSISTFFGTFVGLNEATGKIVNFQNETQINAGQGTIGAICAVNNGTIENCTNLAEIIIAEDDEIIAGGITGTNKGTITNCTNQANLTSLVTEPANAKTLGGIAGSNENLIYSCQNSGNITGKISGGIAGENSNNITIQDPTNPTTFNKNTGAIHGYKAGGIAGLHNGNMSTINYAYNSGTIDSYDPSQSRIGGIIGSVEGILTLTQSFNLGTIGSNTSFNVGGLVGYAISLTTINYCINYGSILGINASGGLGGGGTFTIQHSLSLNTVEQADTSSTEYLGALVGKADQDPFGANVYYDKTVANYAESLSGTYIDNNLLANKQFPNTDLALTSYKLTNPGILTSPAQSLTQDTNFIFTPNIQNTYYYPILSAFSSIFTTTSSADKITMPNITLYSVQITNQKPIQWDSENNRVQYEETSITPYTNQDIEYIAQTNEGVTTYTMFVKSGQKIKPFASLDAYTPQGFDPVFKIATENNAQTLQDFDFTQNTITNNSTIYLTWEGKYYTVTYYLKNADDTEYNIIDDLDLGAYNITTTTIQYSLDPEEAQIFESIHHTSAGFTFNGWYAYSQAQTDTQNIKNDQAELIKDRGNLITQIRKNFIYENGLHLYGNFTAKDIVITLNAGVIYNQQVKFSNGNATWIVPATYGAETTLPITFQEDTGTFVFSGYYTTETYEEGITQKITDLTGIFTCYLTDNITLFAHWTEKMQTVSLISVSIDKDQQADPVQIQVEINTLIPADTLTQANLAYTFNNLDPNGFTIQGYYKDSACTQNFDLNLDKILGPTTLYVMWTVKQFTLTLSAEGILDTGIGQFPSNNLSTLALSIDYNTDLLTYLNAIYNQNNTSELPTKTGSTLKMTNGNVDWFDTSGNQLSSTNNNTKMPAYDITLNVIWDQAHYTLILNAGDGGIFDNGETTHNVEGCLYQTSILGIINNLAQNRLPIKIGYGIICWTDQEGNQITTQTMPANNFTVYAQWEIVHTVSFYVLGIETDNLIDSIQVFHNQKITDKSALNLIEQEINDRVGGGFLFECWLEIVHIDDFHNITPSETQFNLNSEIIGEDKMLIARLTRDPNFVVPTTNTTNYLLVAGGVIVVAMVLLFLLIWSHTKKRNIKILDRKVKNKEIQEKLNELREIEHKRHKLDHPYD